MELCPVCRYRDPTCKIRLLRGQTFFSCKSCYEAEARKHPPRPPEPHDNWGEREPPLPRWDEETILERG